MNLHVLFLGCLLIGALLGLGWSPAELGEMRSTSAANRCGQQVCKASIQKHLRKEKQATRILWFRVEHKQHLQQTNSETNSLKE